ncbi:MAG: xanthine dehydrogenase family protein molybdopterin-binding subunit [Acidimicrobiales bacterium]
MSILGTRVVRVEDPRMLRGEAVYTADVRDERLAGAAHVTYVRSLVAHATLGTVDTEAARAMPGVIDVIVGADIDLDPIAPERPVDNPAMARPFLAVDRVRFVGEPVAAVLTETVAQGADAAEAVLVDYEALPAVVDPEDAAADEVLLFPGAGTNLAIELDDGRDDDLFAGCEVVVTERLVNQRVAAVPLEGRASAAAWIDGRATLWVSTQNAHDVRDGLAEHYDLEPSQVHVIVPDVGGGFGAKIGAHPEDLLLPWLARRIGRPVRWSETRSENLVAMGQGRAQVQLVEIGGRRDGTVLAYRLSVLQDSGAYPDVGATLPSLTRMMAPGTYAFERVECATSSVVTTTTPVIAYRGAGRPEATAAVERAMDLFAAEVGLDPVEVRRTNLRPPFAEPVTNQMGTAYDCGDYEHALDEALAAAGYEALRAEQDRRRAAGDPIALGIGVSTYVEVTAGPTAESEHARIDVLTDGSAVVRTGASPHGQGLGTAFAMVASAGTGIPVERIVVVHGDTDEVARGGGTMGSRSLQLGGAAVDAVAGAVVDRARRLAADLLEAAPEDVVVDRARGRFHVAGTPAVDVGWVEVAARAEADGAPLTEEADFQAGQPTFPFGAHVAVVEVDTETGDARLRRLVAADDAGRILNPLLAEGQRHGGLAQGVGQALYEQVAFDADGNPRTATLVDYAIPSAPDLPGFELVAVATPTTVNPLGAKGIGESATIGSAPAVQSAVCDALAHLGVRHIDMPCTPERVWRAIRAATG